MQREPLIKMLSHKNLKKRLKAIKLLKKAEVEDETLIPEGKSAGILSVHTYYSFSPFSPALAAYIAYTNGNRCVAISDHDTLAGAEEFCRAAEMLGMESGAGLQLRARFYDGKGRWLNNVYEQDVGFVAIRGVPQSEWESATKELAPTRAKRADRDRRMVEKFNDRIKKYGMSLNFEKDVKPLSKYSDGGSITERHILFAFAGKLVKRFKTAVEITEFIETKLKIKIEEEFKPALSDISNPYFMYDLVNCLKYEVKFFYVPADDVPTVQQVVDFAHRHGALITYTYSGEVHRVYEGEEVVFTLEDAYLSELMEDLGKLGFDAVEYIPSNVKGERAENLAALARQNGMFTLPCTDINSPRQRFIPDGIDDNEELVRNLWAVVGHGKSAAYDISDGLNTEKSKAKNPDLEARLKLYAEVGKLKLK